MDVFSKETSERHVFVSAVNVLYCAMDLNWLFMEPKMLNVVLIPEDTVLC